MKATVVLLVLAVALAGAGTMAISVAGFERDMALAEESLATQEYDMAADALAQASGRLRASRWIPRWGAAAQRDIRTHQATLQYWQRQYSAMLPREADPVGAVEGEDVALQMLVANAAYRAGQARATDRESAVQALNEAVSGYMTVLKHDEWDERAAYNFEFLARVRDDIAKGRRKALPPPPEEQEASNGEEGAPVEASDMKAFEVYIPLEEKERNKASEAGKGAPNARKG